MRTMHKQQQGFVSIIVASILMVLISIIAISFSRYMQREQRQSIDRQISSQAYYAAESAVNDVIKELGENGSVAEKTTCDMSGEPNQGKFGTDANQDSNVEVTCLIIDPTPPELEFTSGSLTQSNSKLFPVEDANGGNITSLTFEWAGANGQNAITNPCTEVFPSTRPNSVPVLRIDILPIAASGGTFDRTALENRIYTSFLYPQSGCGASSGSLALNPKGDVLSVLCNSADPSYRCSYTFNNVAATGFSRYFVRVKSIYSDADMRVTCTSTSPDCNFLNAQVDVDATGKATDVVRRIRVKLSNQYPIPEFVLQSMSGVCKKLSIIPRNPASNSVADYDCF